LYEEYEKGNSNINGILSNFADNEEITSRLTEKIAKKYQTKNDEKTIKNAINTYKKERLNTRKLELIEMQKEQGLSQEEVQKIDEEINKIIVELIKIR